MTGPLARARAGGPRWLDPGATIDRATTRRWLAGLFLLSLLGRLALLAWSGPMARGDTAHYLQVAENLARHGQMLERDAITGESVPQTLRTPGYSAVGALFFLAFDSDAHARMGLALLQVLLTSAIPCMAVLLGRKLFSPVVGLWAGAATAVDPWLSYAALTLLSEGVFSAVYMATFLVALRAVERRDWRSALAWGVAIAAAACFRPISRNDLVAVLVVSVVAERHRLGRALRLAAVAGGTALLLLAVWQARNARISGSWQLVTHQGRSLLWETAHLTRPSTPEDYAADPLLARARDVVRTAPAYLPARRLRTGEPENEGEVAYERLRIELGLDQGEADRLMTRIGVENIVANPHRYALRALVNVPRFLGRVSMPIGMLRDLGVLRSGVRESLEAGRLLYPAFNLGLRALTLLAFGPLLIVGLVAGWRRGGTTRWFTLYATLVLLHHFVAVTLVTPDDRYRVPLHGPLSPFVAAGLLLTLERFRRPRRS